MSNTAKFWTDASLDPKRAFRFKATFSSPLFDGGGQYYIKTVQKPGIEISAKEHMYLGHKFFYPGIVSWNPNPIEIKMVDPIDPNSSKVLAQIINSSGYKIPATATDLSTISKLKSTVALGTFKITTVDASGRPVDSWNLVNPFIKSVKFGDLDYSKEDLIEITLQLQYDYCEFADGDGSSGIFKPGTGG